jgi:hypothetical protein
LQHVRPVGVRTAAEGEVENPAEQYAAVAAHEVEVPGVKPGLVISNRLLPDCERSSVPAEIVVTFKGGRSHFLHHGTGADPGDSHTSRRTTRAASRLSRSWPAHQLGRARADP